MINYKTLKKIITHYLYYFSNNVSTHFTFVKIKETQFGDILALHSWIIPSLNQLYIFFKSLVANFCKLVVLFGEKIEN
jgi:hypothetical protein